MNIEFLRATLPGDIPALVAMDAQIFAAYPADLFTPDIWEDLDTYWMLADGQRIGCSAFVTNANADLHPAPGCLYIMTTGILPEFQGRGFGTQQKAWQIAFARERHFTRIVTNTRESNARMIALNQKFGFRQIQLVPAFYPEPEEASVVMALDL